MLDVRPILRIELAGKLGENRRRSGGGGTPAGGARLDQLLVEREGDDDSFRLTARANDNGLRRCSFAP